MDDKLVEKLAEMEMEGKVLRKDRVAVTWQSKQEFGPSPIM